MEIGGAVSKPKGTVSKKIEKKLKDYFSKKKDVDTKPSGTKPS